MNAMITKHNRIDAIKSKVRYAFSSRIERMKKRTTSVVHTVVEAVVSAKRTVVSWFWRTVSNVLSGIDSTLDRLAEQSIA